jgi:hypothetical protein
VPSEYLLYSLVSPVNKVNKESSDISDILRSYDVTQEKLDQIILFLETDEPSLSSWSQKLKRSIEKTIKRNKSPETSLNLKSYLKKQFDNTLLRFSLVTNYFVNLEALLSNSNEVDFSEDILEVFEIAYENALERFNTPVITPEILLITLLEEGETRGGGVILELIPSSRDWLVLRYKLLKRLYYQVSTIQEEIIPNNTYFTYLFKRHLSEEAFNQFTDEENRRDQLADIVRYYRAKLISKIVKYDLMKYLETDIHYSIQSTSNYRLYSARKYHK